MWEHMDMTVHGGAAIRAFAKLHAAARKPLAGFVAIAQVSA
jgi:hypothetical protein